jgi:hypothetical protein
MSNTPIDWRHIVRKTIWRDALHTLRQDLDKQPWTTKMAAHIAWAAGLPAAFMREASQLADFLKVSVSDLILAQVVYDEAWAVDRIRPSRGCTSVSSSRAFGRNLDYGYPENARDLVYHEHLWLDGHYVEVEMFAGLLGWLALSSENLSISVNQAPSLRGLTRNRKPGMFWFRETSRNLLAHSGNQSFARRFANGGEEDMLGRGPASDMLMHGRLGKQRFLMETYGDQLVWQPTEGRGLVAQANVYEIFDLHAGREWERESRQRKQAAVNAASVKAGLRAAHVDGWTIDTFMMR